jgi:hypothetical protein
MLLQTIRNSKVSIPVYMDKRRWTYVPSIVTMLILKDRYTVSKIMIFRPYELVQTNGAWCQMEQLDNSTIQLMCDFMLPQLIYN